MNNFQKYVCGFAFMGQTVVLIEKKRPEWQKGKLNGVGGKIEDGELAQEAMAREFKEETGVLTSPGDWTTFAVIEGENYLCYFLYTKANRQFGRCKTKTDEKIRFHDVVYLSHRTKAIPNLKWLIPMAYYDDPALKYGCTPIYLREINGNTTNTG